MTCKCDGTGKITDAIPESDEWRDVGRGVQIRNAGGYMSRLCDCRKLLPPRDGEARWWTSETVYEGAFTSSVLDRTIELTVKAEVPVSADNYVLKRTPENRYWPTTIDLDSNGLPHFLFPDEAREIARLLLEAADACDAIDKPASCPTCGCWNIAGNHAASHAVATCA